MLALIASPYQLKQLAPWAFRKLGALRAQIPPRDRHVEAGLLRRLILGVTRRMASRSSEVLRLNDRPVLVSLA